LVFLIKWSDQSLSTSDWVLTRTGADLVTLAGCTLNGDKEMVRTVVYENIWEISDPDYLHKFV
jgi:hypothetical protein